MATKQGCSQSSAARVQLWWTTRLGSILIALSGVCKVILSNTLIGGQSGLHETLAETVTIQPLAHNFDDKCYLLIFKDRETEPDRVPGLLPGPRTWRLQLDVHQNSIMSPPAESESMCGHSLGTGVPWAGPSVRLGSSLTSLPINLAWALQAPPSPESW